MLDDKAKETYALILRMANEFLQQGLNYPVQFLAEENPSYADVAKLVDQARRAIQPALEDHDLHLAGQAIEYCYIMARIGLAIKEEDQEELYEWCDKLYKKPFVMPE